VRRRSIRRIGPAGWSLRDQLRRVPTAAWVCALVACLNAACWSIVSPPFEVVDEPAHIAYVKQLAETGHLPSKKGDEFSPEETIAMNDLHHRQVVENAAKPTISSRAQQQKLERDLRSAAYGGEAGSEHAGVATSQPPLYYALETIPYALGSGGTLLDRIALMRLLSALMGGITALFAFLFLRETLPRVPWAWTVGGLSVALVPLLGAMSGTVNPDALLFAVSAAVFYCLARGFRRGLTRRSAVALGALAAIGFMTKVNFVGLAPGVLLGLAILSVRAARTAGSRAYRNLAISLAVALSPVLLYAAAHLASGEPPLGILSRGVGETHGSVLKELSYIWQLYLPRIPGMHADFAGILPTRQIWFDGYVGLYGWLDTTFPGWVYDVALIPAGLILALCARTLLQGRSLLRSRLSELVVYGTMGLGVMVLVGADSYLAYPAYYASYGQARYLLPMIPLLGAVVALASRAGGRRWGPVLGTLIVLTFFAHDLFSQLQTVARFYG
jgi:4-amino-4-deoxy-L-arabinose transferase-like glycosyltransferase